MTVQQKEVTRIAPAGIGALRALLGRHWKILATAGLILTVGAVLWALRTGMARSADQRASLLLSKAKSPLDYQNILAQVPRSYLTFNVLMNLGSSLYAQGKPQEARAQYQKAFESSPSGLDGAAAQCALGMMEAELGNISKAGDCFGRALQLDPAGVKAPEALYAWAQALRAAGDKAGARKKYEQLLEEFPSDVLASEARARIKNL